MDKKKKFKAMSFKKMGSIEKRDERTYYVKGSQEEPYMVYNSSNIGWCCDCLDYVMGNKNCKHISQIRAIKSEAAAITK